MLLRLTCEPGRIVRAEVIPVAGRGAAVGQPHVLEGEAAQAHLRALRQSSAELGTRMEIGEEVGVIGT